VSSPKKFRLQEGLSLALKSNLPVIIALNLSLLSGVFFLVIGYPQLFENLEFFRQRWFGIAVFLISLLITYVSCFYSDWSLKKRLSIWIQSNLLLLFSFAYFLRLNNSAIELPGLTLTTGLIFIPLTLLIFFTNYFLFSGKRLNLGLLLPIVLLFILYSYSFIGFLDADRTFVRNFSQDWLSLLFNLPPFIWLLICSFSITLVTVLNVRQSKSGKIAFFGLIVFILMTQIIIAVESLNTTYWYQTLLVVVSWDFLYGPVKTILSETKDSKYQPRLAVSTIYHMLIFIVILLLT
jgi:hypothetical protein